MAASAAATEKTGSPYLQTAEVFNRARTSAFPIRSPSVLLSLRQPLSAQSQTAARFYSIPGDTASPFGASQGRLTTTYAQPQPGTYFMKAAVYDINFENKVESKPVKVKIEEPEGADREIWNKIKDDGNYVLFLQTGSFVEKPTGPKTINIEASLKEIEEQHPTSRYAVGIRSAVSKRNMILEKVKNSRRTSRN